MNLYISTFIGILAIDIVYRNLIVTCKRSRYVCICILIKKLVYITAHNKH